MTKREYDQLINNGYRPLPGRCFVLLDPVPEREGSIIVPDVARSREIKATGYTGVVLFMTNETEKTKETKKTGKFEFTIGNHVVLGLHMDELKDEVIVARNGQVVAVLD